MNWTEIAMAGGALGLCIGFVLGVYVGYVVSWARFVRKYVSLSESSST